MPSSAFSLSSNGSAEPLFSLLRLFSEGIGLAMPDPWRLVYVNPALRQWAGLPTGPAAELALDDVFENSSRNCVLEQIEHLWQGDAEEATLFAELRCCRSAALGIPVEVRLTPILLDGKRYIALSIQRFAERNGDRLATIRRDPLTGLADRSLLISRLETLLAGDRSTDRRFAVLFIDLDDFKAVNDRHGHLIGDRVLSEVARRLANSVRTGDLLVRYGGDEFVVLLEMVTGWEEFEPVIGRIHAALAEPIAISTGGLTLSASVGAAEVSAEHHTAEDLLAAADHAMYAAKRRKSSRACV